MLTETLGQQTIYDGVDTTVAVATKLEEGHGDSERNFACGSSRIEEQINLAGEEWKPTNSEKSHNDNQHSNNFPLFLDPSRCVLVGQEIIDGSAKSQGVRNLPVRYTHDEDWS